MEIPRHWRLKEQRYKLLGFKISHKDGSVEYEFPPKANPKKILYDSDLLLPPDNQVVHGEVVWQNQEQNNKGQN